MPSPDPGRRRAGPPGTATALAVAFGILFVGTGVNLSFGLLFKPILTELGGSRSVLSLAVTAGMAVNALLQPVLGRLVDRVGPRRVILGGLLVMAGGTGLVAASHRPWQLIVLYGVVAAAGYTAAGLLPVSVHVARWFPGERGFVMTVAACGFSLGQLVVPQLAARVAPALGWRATYLVLAGLVLAAAPGVARWMRDAPRLPPPTAAGAGVSRPGPAAPGPPPEPGARSALRTTAFWWLTGGLIGCGFTDFLLATHLAPFATDRGLPPTAAANAISLWAAANVLGLLTAGALATRHGTRKALAGTYALRAASLLALPLVHETWQLYAFAIAFGATFFTTAPLASTLVAELFGPVRHGAVLGATNLFHHLAGALGAYAGGLVHDATSGYEGIFLAGAGMVAASAVASLLVPVAPGGPVLRRAPA
jgi:MFS family permease